MLRPSHAPTGLPSLSGIFNASVGCAMNKNEVLLLADEYFSGFIVDLEQDPDQSKLRSETGHDVTEEFFSFVNILLHLHGVTTNL